MDEKAHFLAMMKPGRLTLHEDMTEEEEAVFGEHLEYLEQQFEAGNILFAGPSSEAQLGIVVLETDTRQQARAIMAVDPAVARGMLTSEIFEFSVFLMRTV